MALPWRVLRDLGKYEQRRASATALPSALSRRASAMAPARRQTRKGKLIHILREIWPTRYIHYYFTLFEVVREKVSFWAETKLWRCFWRVWKDFDDLKTFWGSRLMLLNQSELNPMWGFLKPFLNSLIWFQSLDIHVFHYLVIDYWLIDCLG